jgi:hypothetical protein
MPFVALFMVINIILGCYLAIRLGYGPPNWQKALNLIIPLKTLQDWLNDGRDWIEMKHGDSFRGVVVRNFLMRTGTSSLTELPKT